MNKLSQINLYDDQGGLSGFGKLGLEPGKGSASDAPLIFSNFISSAVGLITVIAIIWFVFIFMTGAISIITSGGDKNSMESAKKKISSGVIGLVVTIFGFLIIKFIGSLFGVDVLDFASMFESLLIK